MAKKPTKYIFVTGGVLSGLGKGITAASIGNLLKARGLSVNIQKCDPYLNFDAGTLNPAEHGECFVTADGAETDLDLGHYERFLDQELTQASSLMSGRVLHGVIQGERDGKYLGKTVQFIPHVTDAIQKEIMRAAEGFDVHIVEIGGTVGDYESLSFLEAIRELSFKVGHNNSIFVHVVYVPYLGASHEFKTKPAQNAVRELRGLGISPNVLVARTEELADKRIIAKLSLFSGVSADAIALLPNAQSIYDVPLTLEDTHISEVITKQLDLRVKRPSLKKWRSVVERATKTFDRTVTVGLVAKYLDNQDTYMSVVEALRSAAMWHDVNIKIKWVNAEDIDGVSGKPVSKAIAGCDGVVVPGGFGTRALEGKIKTAQYALKKDVPYLGLCLGLQMAVVAAARNAGLKDATSTELDPNSLEQVIHTMNDQKGKENTGGTMRLGNYDCQLVKGSLTAKLYGKTNISERHRHRYECNNQYRDAYASWGIEAVGINPENNLVEIIEATGHPFFVASQFHPEFKSRPNRPHPLFSGFIASILPK
ncbi:CTP synthase [soil metagenome]